MADRAQPACCNVAGVTTTERSVISGVDPKVELQFALSDLYVLVLVETPPKHDPVQYLSLIHISEPTRPY